MFRRRLLGLHLAAAALLAAAAGRARADDDDYPRPVQSCLEAQVALDRADLSCGPIDGAFGARTAEALRAYQAENGLPPTGALDPATERSLTLDSPALCTTSISAGDLARVQPLSPTLEGRARQSALDYPTVLELVAERSHASPGLIRRLNPGVDWSAVAAGAELLVPDAEHLDDRPTAARVVIRLGARSLEVFDAGGALLAHFPVSIAARVSKRPVGELHVTVKVRDPNYTADPENLPDSAELRDLGEKLVLPPGPRNPVGLAWIGLDRTGYGIHGTPEPERIGRPESHGCFRLTNWDALAMLDYVEVGTPVEIEP